MAIIGMSALRAIDGFVAASPAVIASTPGG
jgi:hypothetical protein